MKKPEDLVSVIVPVYNVEKYLNRCIDSIINQTYSQLEIILVDDGSTDESPAICDEYAKKDKRIKVIHKKNRGLSDARNCGLDNSAGNYICFIDSDDYVDTNMIEYMHKSLSKNNSDIVICDYIIFDENNEIKNSFTKTLFSVTDNKFDYMFNEYKLLTVIQWNKLFKREIFDNLRFETGKIHEDEFIICKELESAKKITYDLFPLYHYYRRNNSIMGVVNKKRFDVVSAFNTQYEFFINKGMYLESEKILVKKFFSLVLLLNKVDRSTITNEEFKRYERICKETGKSILKSKYNKINIGLKLRIIAYICFPGLYYKVQFYKMKKECSK